MKRENSTEISGFVRPDFEAVGEAFNENFAHRRELGAACCIYYQGEKVVDLWGGIRDRATGEPWEEDTMVGVFSTAKGMAGLAMALAHSRGLLDYEERVCAYWPEFAQQGKEKITVRQLLSHQAGLFALDAPVDRSVAADLDRLAAILAQQKPAWEPGTRQAYHAQSLGFYEGELLRRVDPRRRSLGQFFQDEIASPLGLDFYLRLPEEIPNSRLATIEKANPALMMFNVPLPLMLAFMNRRSPTRRAVFENPGPWLFLDSERIYARNLENPSGNGVGTARAIAHAYSVLVTGGRELGLRQETLQALTAPAVPPLHGFYDEVMKKEMCFSFGFLKPNRTYPFGSPGAFGEPGAGGSFAFADPEAGLGYAYAMNRMGAKQGGDPRDLALREALRRVVGNRKRIALQMIAIRKPSLEIRPIGHDDLDAVLDVYRQCEDFLALGPVPTASMEMVLKDIEISQNEGGIFCGIFTPDGKMIGIIDYVPSNYKEDPHVAFLELLMIAAPFRNQGVGKAVVEAIENEIRKDTKVSTILSGVQVNNPQAVQFWQRNGYRIVSEPRLHPDQTTAVDLRKNLSQFCTPRNSKKKCSR